MNWEPLVRMRDHCSNFQIFRSAWGFGLALVSGPLVFVLEGVFHNYRSGSFYVIETGLGGVPIWLWRFACLGLGTFTAGYLSYSYLKFHPAGRIWKSILLAGLTFVLVFPMVSFVFILKDEAENVAQATTGSLTYSQLLGGFVYGWISGFDTQGVRTFICVVAWSTIYIFLSQEQPEATARSLQKPSRRRDLVVGWLLILFGFAVASFTWTSLTGEMALTASMAAKIHAPQLLAYTEQLQRGLWFTVPIRSIPFVVVGGLLVIRLTPRFPQTA